MKWHSEKTFGAESYFWGNIDFSGKVIDSRFKRFVVLFTVLGLHLLIGVLFYIDDVTGMASASGGTLMSFFVLLLISTSPLILVSAKE